MVTGQDAVAGDHVINVSGVETGAFGQRREAGREERLRMYVVQPAVWAAPPTGRAYRIENPGVDVGLRSLCEGFETADPY
nr:hypothetical protein MFLOJ_18470 [Mycobacterium florentinum]